MVQDTPSRKLDQYIVRFPDGMRDHLKALADENGRSMNAEIIKRLEFTFNFDDFEANRRLIPPASSPDDYGIPGPPTIDGPNGDHPVSANVLREIRDELAALRAELAASRRGTEGETPSRTRTRK